MTHHHSSGLFAVYFHRGPTNLLCSLILFASLNRMSLSSAGFDHFEFADRQW